MELKYRPEIDGLRTIAVLAVIIYHAEIFFGKTQFLKGGFIGVDVFFVISGFLITSIIMSEYSRTKKFSISNFYERRARRLLPALFIVMIASLPFAWNLLLPLQLVDFSRSILSSLAFGSNFYWNQTLQEYGAESALLKPFLHTWSLAIEEQYYIIFPIILLAIYRWCKTYAIALLTIGFFLSLLFSEIMTAHDASFSFYMLPSRLWELLVGSLLANIMFIHPQKNTNVLLNQIMPIFGFVLIIHFIIFFDYGLSHPGFITLIPVFGTALIIWFANGNDIISKILSTRIFVGIGLISYSLYLWHYPIFAFGRYLNSTPSWDDKALWFILTFTFSLATYFLIEKPFRKKSEVSQTKLFSLLVMMLIIISATNIYWLINNGFDSRLGYLNFVLKDSSRTWVKKDNQKCHSGGAGRKPAFQLSESCVFMHNTDDKYIIAIGDSHAASLSESLRILAKENSYNFIQLTSAGCQHIKGVYQQEICVQRSNHLVSYLSEYPNSIIIYSSRIPLLLEIEKFVNHKGDKEANHKPISEKYINKQFPIRAKAVIDTLDELKLISEKLVIVYPVPEQGFHVKDKLFSNARLMSRKESLPIITTRYDTFKARVKRSYEVLDGITGENIYRVYPEALFCHEKTGKCIVSEGDKIYYAGDNHVSPLGSNLIVDQIAKALNIETKSSQDF